MTFKTLSIYKKLHVQKVSINRNIKIIFPKINVLELYSQNSLSPYSFWDIRELAFILNNGLYIIQDTKNYL